MANPERSGRIHRMGTAVGIGSVFSVLQLVIAWTAGPELVAVGASLGSLLAYVAFQKLTGGMHESTDVKRLRLLKALAPFGCLLVLVLVTRLAPMPAWLKSTPFVWCFERDGHVFKVDLATTPGTLLMLSGCFGAWLGGLRWKATFVLFGRAMWKLRRTAVVVFSILVMAKVMAASGMIRSVAALLASCTGFMFPFISPFLGAMGTFVTGSDTSSNILLGALQKQTAMNTGYDPAWLAAANTAGATAGKMISPQSISVGASTVGLESRQGDVLKVTLLYCLGYLIVLGLGILLSSLIFFRVVSVLPF
jgi:lactate permease